MSLVKNSDDLLVAAAKQCQLDDGTLPKGSDLGDAASFRLDSGFVQARGSTEVFYSLIGCPLDEFWAKL
jgi:hypothetical protein